jgi:GAF domain-containing protein
LQQLLAHLAPKQRLAISLATCMPPAVEGGQVRSLRLIVERSTPPRYFFVEERMLFMGVESPVGQAVQVGRQYATPGQHEQHWIASCYGIASSGSFVATPIVRGTGVAGCLALFSPEANFFTTDHLQLVRSYTELLTLAFEAHEFFERDQIALGAMPMPMRQQALLHQFQERVMRLMRQAAAEGRSLTRPLAEARVWQELGNELLLQDEA